MCSLLKLVSPNSRYKFFSKLFTHPILTSSLSIFLPFSLRYAFYAEGFYCDEERERGDEAAADVAFYKVDFSKYKDIPTQLLNQLFSVWMNKLAGTSNPDIVIPGFHNEFMPEYLKVKMN